MLLSLSIRDFVLIEKLDLTFAHGANSGLGALTGETGAGKSILIDALGLALGARAEFGRGAARRATRRRWRPRSICRRPMPRTRSSAEQGLDDEDVLTLRRTIGADGRGRAFVNDQPASVALLRRLGETLVEIQGQMEQHGLLDMATHRASLDAFAGLEKQAASGARRLARLAGGRAGARRGGSGRRRRAPRRGFPAPCGEGARGAGAQGRRRGDAGGRAAVAARRHRRWARRWPRRWANWSRAAARSRPCAPRIGWSSATSTRRPAGSMPSLAALDRALSEATEAQAQLETARDALEFDPDRLEKIEERLFALRAAARKHGVTVPELAPLAEKMAAQLAALDDGEAGLKKLAGEGQGRACGLCRRRRGAGGGAAQGRGAARQGGRRPSSARSSSRRRSS